MENEGNKRGVKLLDKRYLEYINTLKLDEKKACRVDVYTEIISECVESYGEIIFDEIKYRITDGEDINMVMLDVLSRMDRSGYMGKFKRDIEMFMDEDWIEKYTKK